MVYFSAEFTNDKSKTYKMRLSESKAKFILLLSALFFSFTPFLKKNDTEKNGRAIFERNCVRCHGTDGTKGKWGAKNLTISKLSDDELLTTITNGKGRMPAWRNTLTALEIELLKDYIKTMRIIKP
jgi:mono/diheme cytochrome c family protein